MSFGVSCAVTGWEYSSRGLRGFFGQFRPLAFRQYRLFAEILRFNSQARKLLQDPAQIELRLGDFLRLHRFSDDFSRYYLNPMASAVWSTSLEEIEDFPAFTLMRFFENHGFLGLTTQAQWYVVKGGSSAYIAPLTAPYKQNIHLGAQITGVTRHPFGVKIAFLDHLPEQFDQVVFACHAPQTLQLLDDPTTSERSILSQFRTTRNETVLHTDSHILPRRPAARASWNYRLGSSPKQTTLTYHMNRLQSLQAEDEYCVTLNETHQLNEGKILRVMDYSHPLYTLPAIRAQARWPEISGVSRTHFCGAYWFNGFHEDGLNSAIRVAESLGASWKVAA